MIGTPAIRNLIREGKIAQMYSAIQTGNSVGMQTLDQSLAELVRRNVASSSEGNEARASEGCERSKHERTVTPTLAVHAGKLRAGPHMEREQASNSSTTCCG